MRKSKETKETLESKEEQLRLENVLTFTTSEINSVADFINKMYTEATFNNLKGADIRQINKMFDDMAHHKKKLDDHIFEIKKVIKSPSKDEVK